MPDVSGSTKLVVGAAIVRGSRVLAARRPATSTGPAGWEFPGGKVEPGESLAEALRREIAEELGCTVRVLDVLAGEQPLADGYRLRVARAELCGGEPVPHEHEALRWLSSRKLRSLDWLPADVPFLAQVTELLGRDR